MNTIFNLLQSPSYIFVYRRDIAGIQKNIKTAKAKKTKYQFMLPYANRIKQQLKHLTGVTKNLKKMKEKLEQKK